MLVRVCILIEELAERREQLYRTEGQFKPLRCAFWIDIEVPHHGRAIDRLRHAPDGDVEPTRWLPANINLADAKRVAVLGAGSGVAVIAESDPGRARIGGCLQPQTIIPIVQQIAAQA